MGSVPKRAGKWPERPSKTLICCWCPALATGNVSAHGGGLEPVKVPHCDGCWEKTYHVVRKYPERTWWMVEQPDGLF